ncbi:hypothetical protein SUGI_0495770 [Cryptomeria japonica]|nr:hypothetical protein SUGI_0495770 [Cryptomeria japonica]
MEGLLPYMYKAIIRTNRCNSLFQNLTSDEDKRAFKVKRHYNKLESVQCPPSLFKNMKMPWKVESFMIKFLTDELAHVP